MVHVRGVHHVSLRSTSGSGGEGMLLVASSRVGVVVYPRVPGELVGAGEALRAAWELAGVRLLAGVSADVPRLVLEAVEGLLAERTLVGTGQVCSRLFLGGIVLQHW